MDKLTNEQIASMHREELQEYLYSLDEEEFDHYPSWASSEQEEDDAFLKAHGRLKPGHLNLDQIQLTAEEVAKHPLYVDADSICGDRGSQYELGPICRESYFLTPMDNANMIKVKALRAYAILWRLDHGHSVLDKDTRFVLQDCLRDMVNYAKFCYEDIILSNRFQLPESREDE